MLLQKLKKLIFFGFLFWFDFIEAKGSFANEYILQKRKGNYHLESREICEQTKNVRAAVCSLVFRYLNKQQMYGYKNQDKLLHLNYFTITDILSSCEEKLTDTDNTQIMMSCIGYHQPVHVEPTNDYYHNEIHISHGFQKNYIIIYKTVRMPNPNYDYFIPWFSMFIQWDTLVPAKEELFNLIPNTLQYAYIVDENEAELKYFRLITKWDNVKWNVDRIQLSGMSALRLFHICSTVIQNTYLRSIIELDWNLIPEVPTPVVSKVITQYDNTLYDEINQEVVRILYLIPGSSNHYYKVSSGMFDGSLIFYRWVDTELGEYIVEVHKPVLLVDNITYEEKSIDETGSNLSCTSDLLQSSPEKNDSPRSSSEEGT